jgi:hypothetical protein
MLCERVPDSCGVAENVYVCVCERERARETDRDKEVIGRESMRASHLIEEADLR